MKRTPKRGWTFAEARYYNNQHGRFTAVDPLLASGKSADPQTFNRYSYVGNNPINITDPLGLDWYKKGNKYLWSADNKTFKDGSSVDGSERIDLGPKGAFYYRACTNEDCSSARGAVLLSGGIWDWDGGLYQMINDAAGGFINDLRGMSFGKLENDFNGIMKDPFGEKALGNPGLNMALTGFGSQAQMVKTLQGGFAEVSLFGRETVKDTASTLFKTEARQIEQYSLRAAKEGFYPVMKRGFKDPVGEIFLKQGDVWKYGATINPATRYTQKFLRETGGGLHFKTEFVTFTFKQAIQMEKAKIINFRTKTGFLPPGNKIVN